jgi:solute carrier family 25 carnitine/acylcarnitine transporter 20/29
MRSATIGTCRAWHTLLTYCDNCSHCCSAESALKSFLSGGVGGICVVLVGHPLDLIKVRMQTSGVTGQSVVGMFKNTLAKEGVRGLYRGVTAPLMAIAPIFAVCFWGYDMGQRTIRWAQPTSGDLSIQQKCIAGGLSAIPATALMAPSERVKVLLQTNAGKYSGSLDCAVKVLRDGGIRSLYKGTFATLLRDVPGSMAWFGVYEWTKIAMTKAQGIEDPSQLSPLAVLTAGGFAGTFVVVVDRELFVGAGSLLSHHAGCLFCILRYCELGGFHSPRRAQVEVPECPAGTV